jgi:IclR family acetate operon transcriptional repressor
VSAEPRNAVAKMAAVVEALAGERRTSEIARSTELPVSTVHRILQELVRVGWAREDGDRGYLLGARLLALAGRATDPATVTRLARPHLQELCDRTGHTVHFAARSGTEAVYIDKLEGRGAYHMRSRVGLAVPLHCTAIGKAVLAALPAAEALDLLHRAGTPRRTPHTLTSADAVLAHLATVRERGYSVDDEENELQIRCIGAVVLDHRRTPLGGISLTMLAHELTDARLQQLAPGVVATARAITAALGGEAPAQS